jgi:predicted SPOUT superfamily RNA methylase MTH1
VPHVRAIVRQIARAFPESGKRLGEIAVIMLIAACGSHAGSVAAGTPPRAAATIRVADRLTPTVVAVSPGAGIEWGFRVAMAGMLETHAQFAESRISSR